MDFFKSITGSCVKDNESKRVRTCLKIIYQLDVDIHIDR